MKGVVVENVGGPYKVVDDLEKPKPGADQILVKSIYAAINPVETIMQGTGLMVSSWPIVLGCDASGIVVEAGENAKDHFQVGDQVSGCTRLGEPGYGTFQEFFLMDASLTLANKKHTLQQGATLGAGSYTAALGLFDGLNLELPDPDALPSIRDEWVIVFGGAGSVGQYAVQLAKLSGYKVAATCSTKTATLVKELGADEIIDYRQSEDDQLQAIKQVTGGNFSKIFDSVAKSGTFALKVLDEASGAEKKYFSTTNDWETITSSSVSVDQVALGPIGKPDAKDLNGKLVKYIPVIFNLLDGGKIKPNEVHVFGQGFEKVAAAVEHQQKGTGAGSKVVVELGKVED